MAFFFIAFALLINIILLIAFHRRLRRKQAVIVLQKEDYFERANLLKAEIDQEWKTINLIKSKIINYGKLKDLTEQLSLSLGLEETSKTLCAEVNKLFGHKEITVILYLFQSVTGELGISSSQKGQMGVNLKAKKGDLFDQWVVKTLNPLLVEDANIDFRFDAEKIMNEDSRKVRALISAPLIIGDKILGILRIDSPNAHHFATDDLRFLRTIADITGVAIENAQLYQKIQDLAIRDGLTGLYLRRYMLERMTQEVNRGILKNKELCFMMIDLDYFKKYNDTYGHIAGDIVLRAIAGMLAEHFDQAGDLVCRYGGEEFCVLLPDCSKAKAVELANAIKDKISSREIVLRRQKTHITSSIGVAAFPTDVQSKEELIAKADEALYRAKSAGRNQVCEA